MKPNRMNLALLFAVCIFPAVAIGQTDSTASSDEIVVVGEKSLADLRRDTFEAEEDFYSVYNKLNDEREYDVRCFYESPTGTHQKNHVCRARFVTKAYGLHASRNGNDLSRVANQDANSALAEKTARYQEIMETLIDAYPELQAALIRYNTMRAQFFAKRDDIDNN